MLTVTAWNKPCDIYCDNTCCSYCLLSYTRIQAGEKTNRENKQRVTDTPQKQALYSKLNTQLSMEVTHTPTNSYQC